MITSDNKSRKMDMLEEGGGRHVFTSGIYIRKLVTDSGMDVHGWVIVGYVLQIQPQKEKKR